MGEVRPQQVYSSTRFWVFWAARVPSIPPLLLKSEPALTERAPIVGKLRPSVSMFRCGGAVQRLLSRPTTRLLSTHHVLVADVAHGSRSARTHPADVTQALMMSGGCVAESKSFQLRNTFVMSALVDLPSMEIVAIYGKHLEAKLPGYLVAVHPTPCIAEELRDIYTFSAVTSGGVELMKEICEELAAWGFNIMSLETKRTPIASTGGFNFEMSGVTFTTEEAPLGEEALHQNVEALHQRTGIAVELTKA